MPLLPLNHPEPFAATLGVMLYPAIDGTDPLKARALAAHFLSEPVRRATAAGHPPSYATLARLATDSGERLDDLDARWWGGLAVGDLFKALFALAGKHPALASWENATRIYDVCGLRAGIRGSRTKLLEAKRRFLRVAHLWGAWSIREGKFGEIAEVGYDGFADFQSFLAEAEILRDFGQNWLPPRSNSKPPLPEEVWQTPKDWIPPARQPGWPMTGAIPRLMLPDDLIGTLKPPGRPRKGL